PFSLRRKRIASCCRLDRKPLTMRRARLHRRFRSPLFARTLRPFASTARIAEETSNRNEDMAAHVRSSYKLNRFRPLAPLAALHLCQSFSLFSLATRAQVRRGSEDLRFRVAELHPRFASKCTESLLFDSPEHFG